jgi:hypothetical protein
MPASASVVVEVGERVGVGKEPVIAHACSFCSHESPIDPYQGL